MGKIDPSKLSDEEFSELQKKVAREAASREEKRKADALLKNREYLDKLRDLPFTTILALFEHDRTSCSDENIINGWWSNEDDNPRCKKCALIETLKGTFPSHKIVTFTLSLELSDP